METKTGTPGEAVTGAGLPTETSGSGCAALRAVVDGPSAVRRAPACPAGGGRTCSHVPAINWQPSSRALKTSLPFDRGMSPLGRHPKEGGRSWDHSFYAEILTFGVALEVKAWK